MCAWTACAMLSAGGGRGTSVSGAGCQYEKAASPRFIETQAVVVAVGINWEGRRGGLGVKLPSELDELSHEPVGPLRGWRRAASRTVSRFWFCRPFSDRL